MLNSIHTVIFDFDGVFTDNFVYSDAHGNELVKTSRSDSYGLSNFRKFCTANLIKLEMFILSTETNEVVRARANKLNLESHLGIEDKASFINNYFEEKNKKEHKFAYLGNDLNDLECIKMAEFSFSPSDAHFSIKSAVTHPLESQGGNGFVREALEYLQLNTLIRG